MLTAVLLILMQLQVTQKDKQKMVPVAVLGAHIIQISEDDFGVVCDENNRVFGNVQTNTGKTMWFFYPGDDWMSTTPRRYNTEDAALSDALDWVKNNCPVSKDPTSVIILARPEAHWHPSTYNDPGHWMCPKGWVVETEIYDESIQFGDGRAWCMKSYETVDDNGGVSRGSSLNDPDFKYLRDWIERGTVEPKNKTWRYCAEQLAAQAYTVKWLDECRKAGNFCHMDMPGPFLCGD
jgi:hypothetical protein